MDRLCRPEDLRQRAEAEIPATAGWFQRRLAARWYPRDMALAAAHIVRRLQGGDKFWLHGAGSHSQALLDRLDALGMTGTLAGISDKIGGNGRFLAGRPVLPMATAVADTTAMIVVSHHEFEDSMRDDLLALGASPERIIPIYTDDGYGALAMEKAGRKIGEKIAAIPDRGGKKRVVFASARPRRIIDDDQIALLDVSGALQCITLRLDRDAVDQSDAASSVWTVDAKNSLAAGFFALELLMPDLVVVQEHYSSGNFLPLAFGLAFPPKKILAEFYDFLALTFDDPHVLVRESYWRPEDVELALAAEKWCVANLAGIISKESGPELARYLEKSRFFEMRPHLSSSRFKTKTEPCRSPPRLVWAGAINPSSSSPCMFGDNQLIDVFSLLAQLGFDVCARTSVAGEAMLQNNYADYLELAARRQNFSIYSSVPREKLLDILCREHDFGLMLGIPKVGTQQAVSHKVTVSGKMFTYLAAGLPVIVGAYLEVMAAWVQEHGLGIVVDHRQIAQLPGLIEQADYAALVTNVAAYRRSHRLETILPHLLHFLTGTGTK